MHYIGASSALLAAAEARQFAAFVGMERSALHRKLKSLGVFGNERPLKTGT